MEEVTDLNLIDVFNVIKQDAKSYINYANFKHSVLEKKPDCLKDLIVQSADSKKA